MILNTEDWFAIGLGLDIAGATLLAKGLLLSPHQIASSSTWAGIASLGSASLRDRVDAEFGLIYLLCGFALQVVGYTAIEAGAVAGSRGTAQAVAFIGLAAAVVGLALLLYRLLRPRRTKAVARRVVQENRNSTLLVSWGSVIGEAPLEGETYREYGLRVFGVEPTDNEDELIKARPS